MNKMTIYFLDDSELAEYEAISKGYRTDIYVEIEDIFYNVSVYTILRLQQDFESENEDYGYYSVDPNLILVSGLPGQYTNSYPTYTKEFLTI